MVSNTVTVREHGKVCIFRPMPVVLQHFKFPEYPTTSPATVPGCPGNQPATQSYSAASDQIWGESQNRFPTQKSVRNTPGGGGNPTTPSLQHYHSIPKHPLHIPKTPHTRPKSSAQAIITCLMGLPSTNPPFSGRG